MKIAKKRLKVLESQINPTLTFTDNRTGKKTEVPVKNGFVDSKDFAKATDNLKFYDPGCMETITCTSKISYIDGEKGILEYRGYPIEQLAEKSSFVEVSFLLIYGELPSLAELKFWKTKIMNHTYLHTDIERMMKFFHYDAHPMGIIVSTVSAMSTFQPEQNPTVLVGIDPYSDSNVMNKQIQRIIGRMPTIAANAYRHRIGLPFNEPAKYLSYVENFLYMMDKLNETRYKPHPKLVKALEVLFILHAEHELTCSTAAMRHLASSEVDVYTCIAGAIAALYGRKHGGANVAVLRMLEEIGSVENIDNFIESVKAGKTRLMGFGHRVYKSYDPRAKIVRKIAEDVFSIAGREPLIDIAMALEKRALVEEYFIKRKLYPNIDFYTGVTFKAMGFPTDMFPVLFTIPTVVGWLAHWKEFQSDPENRIFRPRQNYTGSSRRDYVEVQNRKEYPIDTTASSSKNRIRREFF